MAEGFDKFLAVPTSQKVALLVVLMALIGAGWYFLMFEEVSTNIGKEAKRTPALNKSLSEEQEIEKNLVKYQEEIEQLKKVRDEMRDRLPDSAEIADLLQKIHGQAKIFGLEIARFERGDTVLEQTYARIPVRMTLKGSFNQVSTFFYYLGKLTRIVNVENIELTAANRQDSGSDLVAICTATTFQYLPPGAAAAAGGKKRKK
ncbi:MAG: type 4a pilus biogenesis protein PilO [Myxococcales bacterium]|nr:type 4a pilus biogenesis protein PilO [Myxococcales bacterium]